MLVHGAGHTAAVWAATQAALSRPSLAVDLPGRAGRPADITGVRVASAAASVAADVVAGVDGDVVLVGHSAAGILLPSIAAVLGPRVERLVFVAGLAAPEGVPPTESFMPGQAATLRGYLADLRRTHAGRRLEELDTRTASAIDSLNLSCEPMRWAGTTAVPRTYVTCRRDRVQPPEVRARLVAACAADEVVDMDTGHTPALEAPALLASVLDAACERAVRRPATPRTDPTEAPA